MEYRKEVDNRNKFGNYYYEVLVEVIRGRMKENKKGFWENWIFRILDEWREVYGKDWSVFIRKGGRKSIGDE